MHWQPRCSQLGGYLLCDYRAALDKFCMENGVAKADGSSPYADLGTCIHFATLGALSQVRGPKFGPPTPEQRASALTLFDDETTLDATIAASAKSALAAWPKGDWHVEQSAEIPGVLQGTADALSSDGTVLVDLKTAGKPPAAGKLKPEYLAQTLAYSILFPRVTTIHVLYVDSKGGKWTCLVTVNVLDPHVAEYRAQIRAYLDYLMGPDIAVRCTPRIGAHCDDGYCPHTRVCRDRIMPPPGIVTRPGSSPKITDPFNASK